MPRNHRALNLWIVIVANGNMGKRTDDATRLRALELIAKGNSPTQVAQRLGLSTAYIRKAWQAEQERLAINQEVPDDAQQAEDSI